LPTLLSNTLSKLSRKARALLRPRVSMSYGVLGGSGYNVRSITGGQDELDLYAHITRACIDERADAIASLKWKVYIDGQKQGEKIEVERDHWLARLWERPMPEFKQVSRQSTLRLIEQYLCIKGKVYIWTPCFGGSIPTHIVILPVDEVTPIAGASGGVESYRASSIMSMPAYPGGTIPEREILTLTLTTPARNLFQQLHEGRSLVQGAISAIVTEQRQQEYLQHYFDNFGVPPHVVSGVDTSDPIRLKQMKAQWEEDYNRTGGRKPLAFLPTGAAISAVDTTSQAKNLMEMTEPNRLAICAIFHVPPGRLSGDYQNRSTAEVQDLKFYHSPVRSQAELIEQGLSAHFQALTGESLLIEHVPFTSSDPEELRAAAELLFDRGSLTRNQLREMFGHDKIEEPDADRYIGLVNTYAFVEEAFVPPPIGAPGFPADDSTASAVTPSHLGISAPPSSTPTSDPAADPSAVIDGSAAPAVAA
jgi:HK97 family phage portal protein